MCRSTYTSRACSTQLELVPRPFSAASLHLNLGMSHVESPSSVPTTQKARKMINGSSRQRFIPKRQRCLSIFNAKPTAAHQRLRFSMAPSPQAFTAKPTSFTQIRQKCCSIVNAKPTGPDQRLRFSMAPSPQAFTAKPTSFTQIRQKCCSIVNAKPAAAHQRLRFSMAPSPQAFTAKPTSFTQIRQKWCSIVNAKPTGPDQLLRFSMAPSPQAFTAKPTSFTQIRQKRCSIVNAKPTGADQLWGWAWLFPSAHISHAASSIRSFTQICKKCSSIVNAKPTGADQPLRFSMALPLKPYQKLHPNPTKFSSILNANPTGPVHLIPKHFLPSLFIQQKLHANRAKVFEHLQCEAHRTISAVELQHGSSHTKSLLAHGFAPSEASPKSTTNVQASSMRSPPGQISRWGSSDISYPASSKRSFTQIRHKCSSSFNAKITRPARSFQFQQAHRTISNLYWQKLLLHTYCTSIQGPLRAKFHPGNGTREICFRQPSSHTLLPSLRQIGVEE